MRDRETRWPPAEPVPAIARGARLLVFLLAAAVILFGPLALAMPVASPAVSYQLGITGTHRATITDREYEERPQLSRRNCDGWWYHVTWEGGAGRFKVCENRDPGLRVGDSLRVGTGVLGDVVPEWELGAEFVALDVVLAVIAGWFAWVAARLLWFIRRLRRGRVYGVRLSGTVLKAGRNSMTARVSVDDGDGFPYRYRGNAETVPAVPIRVGSRVRIWGCRTGWLTGKPKGPWAVSVAGGEPELYLLGRVRRR